MKKYVCKNCGKEFVITITSGKFKTKEVVYMYFCTWFCKQNKYEKGKKN